ncbi:hypothetical protein [Myxacorys almedinensis]|uniref:Transposase n=1 Tax=Myxacorys almedinensis A TaxID=2690445 RepID=A0A8J7Z1T2_9CYAN|nr:hypothetical protein [Myxacorys almedinensis]NDJ18792.1 hypothetical protein [Myxacorys almedinensis A]
MTQLKRIISTALEQTAVLWKPIATAFDWVHQVATLLDNDAQLDGQNVCSSLGRLLRAMERWKDQAGSLAPGIDHFLKVTLSYAPGLFHCYDIEGLPRTNNDLEQLFGRWRHHQRRCTGRKVAPASLVVRGSVQIVAAIATQIRSFTAHDLATVSLAAWQSVRADLKRHQHKRNQQPRFRRSPATYLADLEQKFLQLALPP